MPLWDFQGLVFGMCTQEEQGMCTQEEQTVQVSPGTVVEPISKVVDYQCPMAHSKGFQWISSGILSMP